MFLRLKETNPNPFMSMGFLRFPLFPCFKNAFSYLKLKGNHCALCGLTIISRF